MKLSRQTSTGGPTEPQPGEKTNEPKLPHEHDQTPADQEEDGPRQIGKQGYSDVQHGLEDTDRRGGGDYQQRTQNDAIANTNSTTKHDNK